MHSDFHLRPQFLVMTYEWAMGETLLGTLETSIFGNML